MFPLLAAILASVLISAKDVVSKSVADEVHPLVSSFASFLFAIPYYLIILVLLSLFGLENFSWQGSFWTFVFLRALSDTGAESGRMIALKEGELSSVSAIIALNPIITLFLSPILTGDALSPSIIFGVILATLGTYFFSKVPKAISRKTLIVSLVTAVFFSLDTCFDRLSVLSASPAFSGFAMNTFAALLTLPFAIFSVGIKKSTNELGAQYKPFLLRGFFETIFMVLKLYAMTTLQAPVLSALLRLSLVFQVIAGRTFFNEEGLMYRIIGSVLIIGGSILALL